MNYSFRANCYKQVVLWLLRCECDDELGCVRRGFVAGEGLCRYGGLFDTVSVSDRSDPVIGAGTPAPHSMAKTLAYA